MLDRAESEGRILLTRDNDFWQIAVQHRSPLKRSGESFCSEFILQLPKISRRSYVRLSTQTPRGLDTSASSQWREFRWWRRAESEGPTSPAETSRISVPDVVLHNRTLLFARIR
jgi:hypothetical protein